jgi:hypothetical protein
MRRFAPRVIAFTGISDRLAAESVSKVSGIRIHRVCRRVVTGNLLDDLRAVALSEHERERSVAQVVKTRR